MKNFAIYFGILLFLCLHAKLCAQDENPIDLEHQKEIIMGEEREALRLEIEKINNRLEAEEISYEEASTLKQQLAEKHALNIENRIAILENETALKLRNDVQEPQKGGTIIQIGLKGNFVQVSTPKSRKYDRRTKNDFVFAFGLNNVITEGEKLQDSDFKMGGSRFAELGWSWKTRVLNNSNFLRIKYGFSFQFNGLKPTDNRIFVSDDNETVLETFPQNLNKSKFRMDNLVFPVHIELGPSKKVELENSLRYSTRKQFRIGLGGYTGFNLNAIQKLKYNFDDDKIKTKSKNQFDTNDFIYGLSAYMGWQYAAIYVKYDLNPIFKNNPIEQRNISLGLRFDLD
jgi:hypothetical protein